MSSAPVDLIVKVSEGLVQGKRAISIRGGVEYFSFQGIPYAKPPIGPLRFQAPEPAEPWQGIRTALKEGNKCCSMMMTGQYITDSNEDCLFINVYTPRLPGAVEADVLKPVLFWIHGGGFAHGSGDTDMFGPDYLITEDVVVVTFNYRLGVFGFLSMSNQLCPGNFGLKDMVVALHWVQRNIASFGGDPNNVTIFGESAGGVAVHYLLLSHQARGLFHKAISQSGTALGPRAFNPEPTKAAFVLGKLLGLETTDEEELFEFLKGVPPRKLVEAQHLVRKQTHPEEAFASVTFAPCVEPVMPGAFLTKGPREQMREGDISDVPYILGVNTLEGLIVVDDHQKLRKRNTDEECLDLIPPDIKLDRSNIEACSPTIRKIKEFYFSKGYSEQKLVDLLSSVFYINGVNRTVGYLLNNKARRAPTYLYQFSFDGNKALYKVLLGFTAWKGTSHGDELGYLFHVNLLHKDFNADTREGKAVETLTRLWTNFARHGNPTPGSDKWRPISKDNMEYLDIGDNLGIYKDLKKEETEFWSQVYQRACEASRAPR